MPSLLNARHFLSWPWLRSTGLLAVHFRADPTAKVDCQILCLIPATVEDDPTQVHDRRWSMYMDTTCENVIGQYVHLLNPSISVLTPGKPMFLFKSSFLVNLSCSLFQDLQPEDHWRLPMVKCSEFFPYHMSGEFISLYSLVYYSISLRDGLFRVQQKV